jgi:aminocarboxymuconate-semialdehyde decarboxylase
MLPSNLLHKIVNTEMLAVHGGGYLGAYSGRIDHAWGAWPDCRADLPHPPTHYLKNVFVDSVVFTPQQLNALVEIFGADHVVMGTDYPFDMAESDPLGHLASVQSLDQSTISAIAGTNARKLFGL